MKTILFSLLVLTGAFAKAQSSSSQSIQTITLRLVPVSFIDFASAETGKPARQAAKDVPAASSLHEIIVNKNRSQEAALPPSAEQENPYKHTASYTLNASEPVYTFSSR